MPPPSRSFTWKPPFLSNLLVTPTKVGIAFDPSLTAPPPLKQFNAIWDTGATHTAISKRLVDECGLKPTGMTEVHFGGGTQMRDTYFVSIMLPNDVGFPQVRVTEFDAIRGTDALIGMDIITQGDFAITHKDRKTTFSFRCPSVECIDFAGKMSQPPMSVPKVGRNAPCPCGSGKKYKQCHGKRSKTA